MNYVLKMKQYYVLYYYKDLDNVSRQICIIYDFT